MSRHSIDYNSLSQKVSTTTHKLSDVKNRLEKVAFDIVRFRDGDPDELWQVQNSADGDYIVARYTDTPEETTKTASSKNPWEVLVSKAGWLHVYFAGAPLAKFAAAALGLSVEDLDTAKRTLPAKLASDKRFVKALLATLGQEQQEEILKATPEILQ
jgi:hypothetical protein